MPTTQEYINQLKIDKQTLVDNLASKGISDLSGTETFTELVPKVLDITSGATPTGTIEISENGTYDVTNYASANVNVSGGSYEWQPEPDWWDIEQIIEDDTENYDYKFIVLLIDNEPTMHLSPYTMGEKIKTSDGATYTSSTTHTWDTTKDKPCSKGYKTRYYICYSNTGYHYYPSDLNSLYIITKGLNPENISGGNMSMLQAIKYKDNVFAPTTNVFRMLAQNLKSLKKVYGTMSMANCASDSMDGFIGGRTPADLSDTEFVFKDVPIEGTSAFSDFSGKLPKTLSSTLYVKNASRMFYNTSLEEIPSWVNFDNVTNYQYMFGMSYYLKKIPNRINMTNATSSNTGNMFYNCNILQEVYFSNLSISFNQLSSCPFLKKACLLDLLENLVDLTGQTSQSLTLGATNLAKLTEEEISIATNKGWSVS